MLNLKSSRQRYADSYSQYRGLDNTARPFEMTERTLLWYPTGRTCFISPCWSFNRWLSHGFWRLWKGHKFLNKIILNIWFELMKTLSRPSGAITLKYKTTDLQKLYSSNYISDVHKTKPSSNDLHTISECIWLNSW